MSHPPMAFHLYKDSLGMWRWYLMTEHGRRVADSGQYFWDRRACEVSIDAVRSAIDAPVLDDPTPQMACF